VRLIALKVDIVTSADSFGLTFPIRQDMFVRVRFHLDDFVGVGCAGKKRVVSGFSRTGVTIVLHAATRFDMQQHSCTA
jgi:hypothetical protein